MTARIVFLGALLAAAAGASPARAVECNDPNVAVDLVGSSPAGDAFALRRVVLGERGGRCPYPSVKGRCTRGVALHVCRTGGTCKRYEVYETVASEEEEEQGDKSPPPTPQAEAARNLAAAKKAMADAKIALADGTALGSVGYSEGVTIPAAELKALGDPGAVTLAFPGGGGVLEARLADESAIPLATSGWQGDAGWVHGEVAVALSADRKLLTLAIFNECDGSPEIRPVALRPTELSARLLNARGYRRLRAGDAAGAVEALTRAVEADPGFAIARCNLGLALVKAGRGEEGLAALAEAFRRGDASGATPVSCR